MNFSNRVYFLQGGKDPIYLQSKDDYMMAVLRVIWEQPENYSLAFFVQPDKNLTAILSKVYYILYGFRSMIIVILLVPRIC